jgi:uroporphyrinogen-III synthase
MPELSGVTVVVTRPAHQADNLCQLIEAAGGMALRFPAIEIAPASDVQKCRSQLADLSQFDLAIFISANAVNATFEMMPASAWPSAATIAAVGKATAQALSSHGQTASHIASEPFNSEALLSLSELQSLDGKRILIFRGNGGRELLREKLCERGAKVEYIECYQRVRPTTDTQQLYASWDQKQTPHIIVVTSNQGLHNLLQMIDETHRPALLGSLLVVISQRTARLANELGFLQAAKVASAATDEAILEALKTA